MQTEIICIDGIKLLVIAADRNLNVNGINYQEAEQRAIIENYQCHEAYLQEARRLLTKICDTFTIAHIMAGLILILFVDMVGMDRLPYLMSGITYCFAAAGLHQGYKRLGGD